MVNKTSEARDFNHLLNMDDLIDKTSHLSADVENLTAQLKEQKEDVSKKYDKIDIKLDTLTNTISNGFSDIKTTQATQGLKIQLLETDKQEAKNSATKQMDWKLAVGLCLLGPILEAFIHFVLHVK